MQTHSFIFQPGCWLGQGHITIQGAIQPLKFYTKWIISQEKEDVFLASQTVEIENVEEHVVTAYRFTKMTETHFSVLLENGDIGQVLGPGFISPDAISWEFDSPSLQGFDTYERLANGNYRLHAEYSSSSQYRTIIHAELWKKL